MKMLSCSWKKITSIWTHKSNWVSLRSSKKRRVPPSSQKWVPKRLVSNANHLLTSSPVLNLKNRIWTFKCSKWRSNSNKLGERLHRPLESQWCRCNRTHKETQSWLMTTRTKLKDTTKKTTIIDWKAKLINYHFDDQSLTFYFGLLLLVGFGFLRFASEVKNVWIVDRPSCFSLFD